MGLAFAFGLMNVINMAHGEFIMVGAYVAYVFQLLLAPALGGVEVGTWFLMAIPAAFLATALLGGLMEITLVRHLYGRPLDTLLATWGVGLILQQAARSIFGAPNVNVISPSWLNGGVNIGVGLLLAYKRIFIIGLVFLVVIAVYFYLHRTRQGRQLRAVMQNREMASCLGVRSRWVDATTFALGTGLAGVAGCALTLIGPIGPSLGTFYIVDAFMVVVLGGVGSLPGAILAAIAVGVANTALELSTTTTVGKVLVLLAIIVFLQWKPSGLAALQTR
ncbi:putative ABC transporter permease protein [Caldilinea aerophila DSM 14535 = NBRC 104270]|uniref:Putative ABC transporter permease protein n=1 Tax=Caldilinea aerophila (strain DSM 14535 / JCM 11387 / NBRC 104270 / STL-6-O1) TaxID=926550 RepID=I0HZB6_CALAS|nr:putative ABC transporter permease protein [Caldilinea aerophila DSM 14535 = NBRC 104270]